MQHDLAYRAIATGSVDVIDLYSTDPEIEYYDLRRLEDDLAHFPRYDAVVLYRLGLRDAAVATGMTDGMEFSYKLLDGLLGEL